MNTHDDVPRDDASATAPSGAGSLRKLFVEMQEWMFVNGILTVAAGWVVGVATKEMLDRVIAAALAPIATWLVGLPVTRAIGASAAASSVTSVLGAVTWWIVIIATSFVVLELALGRRVFRLKTAATGEARVGLAKARALAEEDKIVLDAAEAEDLARRKAAEVDAGRKEVAFEDAAFGAAGGAPFARAGS